MIFQKPEGQNVCKEKGCRRTYSQHSGRRCAACGFPVEHHTSESETECWANRARMAQCRGRAGLDLSEVDQEALMRCPDPEVLTADGYRVMP